MDDKKKLDHAEQRQKKDCDVKRVKELTEDRDRYYGYLKYFKSIVQHRLGDGHEAMRVN